MMIHKLPSYLYNSTEIQRFNRFYHPSGKRQKYIIHSYNSLVIACVLGHKYNLENKDNPVNLTTMYGKIIFSVLTPKFFGDIPKSIREQYPDLDKTFELAKNENAKLLLNDFGDYRYQELFNPYLMKDSSIEQSLVQEAESISVLMKCEEELRSLNNRALKKLKAHIKDCFVNNKEFAITKTLIDEFKDEEFEDLEHKGFFDIYVETLESIKSNGSDTIQWYMKTIYFNGFTRIINNMNEVFRWNNVRCIIPDSDSQHSFFVAMWSFILSVIENTEFGSNISVEKAVSKALFHDIHEALTSDILSYIKRINPEIKSFIDIMEDDKNKLILHLLPKELQEAFYPYICDAKGEAEGKIVHISDKLEAAIKSLKEIQLNGDKYFKGAYDDSIRDVLEYANDFKSAQIILTFSLHEFLIDVFR